MVLVGCPAPVGGGAACIPRFRMSAVWPKYVSVYGGGIPGVNFLAGEIGRFKACGTEGKGREE